MISFPDKKYQIIYADPPWNYSGEIFYRGGAQRHFNLMQTSHITRIPIQKYCDWNCACFLWAVFPKLEEAIFTLKAWGFEYKTVAFTWVKMNKKSDTPFFGMGKWTRSNAEICLLGVRGTIKRINASVPQIVISPIKKHSQKPYEIKDRIIKLIGDLPRIELFAREKTEGWDVWGNEVNCDITL